MNAPAEFESPAAMRELIQYFETHGRLLDRQELGDGAAAAMATSGVSGSFVSCIRFNGVPILPPVMTVSRRDEVRQARHDAIFQEKRMKARQRKQLMASVVENTDASQSAGSKTGRGLASKLPLERPSVLKPVATSAWASVASGAEASSVQCNESSEVGSVMAASTLGNTFATAEHAQEDFGLQTLDSVCSDFMSMEETLPTDFAGVPLTSVKQQKISHDLLRLSKILKVTDLGSTGGSEASEMPAAGSFQAEQGAELRWVERVRTGNTATLDNISASFFHESQDTVVEVTADNATENTTSGFVDTTSNDGSPAETSSQGDGNLSGVGSSNTSGMSSANTTATSESQRSNRSSPRSLKNTVHFASFVTEYIDTSASLSSENITVVKKKMSAELGGESVKSVGVDQAVASVSLPAGGGGGGGGASLEQIADGLLGKVSLSEPDSPEISLPSQPNLPFQSYSKADPSTSDKENDSKQANKISGMRENVSSSTNHTIERPKVGRGGTERDSVGSSRKSDSVSDSQSTLKTDESSARHRSGAGNSVSVSDSQGSSRSDATAATSSSSSTLIEDAVVASKDSTSLPLNIVEPKTEEPSKAPNDKQQTATRKPKKHLPEPPQGSRYATHTKRGGSTASQQSKESEEQGQRGLVRCGSYTLLAPSPALMHAQGMMGDAAMAAGGDSSKQVQRKLHYDETEDHTKPLNVPSMVPSEPESTGKAEHINKYLSQVQLHSSDDVTASHVSADHDSYNPEVSAQLHNSYNLLHSLMRSQASVSSAGSGEALHEFQSLRQNLLEQQQRELEELFIQQRREQMMLQNEIEEHQKRMKEQQDFLITNAPENIKVQSQAHDGELSPDSNSGDETNLKRFNFPPPKQAGHSGGGAGILSPSTLMFNTSASSTSPKVRRPVLRSPVKFYPGRRPTGRIITPPEAYEPGMKEKFDKLTATGRGFLTRCLLNSDKVQGLVKTIKDTREFAFSFQSETPIKKGNFTSQDRNLLERIVAQLQAALLDVHEIFFDTSIPEQMALIEQTRMNSRERSFKLSTDESVRGSGPRISAATLKALERKKKAQEAEASVFGAAAVRPRTAPPATSSPRSHTAVDLSGPLKRHYQSLLAKAMKPAAMQAHHAHLQVSPIRPDNNTARSEKSRPQTAPEKSASSRPKKPVTTSVVTGGGHSTESNLVKPTIRLKQQQPQQPPVVTAGKSSKTERKSSKSWR